MTVTTVARSQFKSFLNTTPLAAATYNVIGQGVTTGKIAYNPKTLQEIYVDQTTGTTEVESYMPNYPIEATCKQGDPVFNFIDAIRMNRSILDNAHTDMVNVWLYQTPVGGAYPAEKQPVSIQIENFGGDGGVVNKINYTINFLGAATAGTFNPTTATFTSS
jgi:hypothetical protein